MVVVGKRGRLKRAAAPRRARHRRWRGGASRHRCRQRASRRGIVDPRRGFARGRRRIGGAQHRLRRRHGRRQARCPARPVPRSSAPRTPASSSLRNRGRSPARDRSARATASTTARSARAPCRGGRRRARGDREAAQIRAPDIAAIDHAEREDAVRRRVARVVDLLGRAHEVEMQAGNGGRERRVKVVAERTKIARQHDLDLRHGLAIST